MMEYGSFDNDFFKLGTRTTSELFACSYSSTPPLKKKKKKCIYSYPFQLYSPSFLTRNSPTHKLTIPRLGPFEDQVLNESLILPFFILLLFHFLNYCCIWIYTTKQGIKYSFF